MAAFHPTLRHLNLSTYEIGPYLPNAALDILTGKQSKLKLHTLRYAGNYIGGEGFSRLASWEGLESLVALDLSDDRVTTEENEQQRINGLSEFFSSPHWKDLRELHLQGTTLRDLQSIEMLLGSPRLSSLRILSLGPPQDEGARAMAQLLVSSSSLSNLTELWVDIHVELAPQAVEMLTAQFGEIVRFGRIPRI